MRNFQEKVTAFSLVFQMFFLDHKIDFFLTVGQNNFGNKIPFLMDMGKILLIKS